MKHVTVEMPDAVLDNSTVFFDRCWQCQADRGSATATRTVST